MDFLKLIFILGLVCATTLLFYSTTRMLRPAGAASLKQAFRALVDWAGAFAIFLSANVALGVVLILIVRGVTQHFFALYVLEDLLLLILSAAQAFVFQMWW